MNIIVVFIMLIGSMFLPVTGIQETTLDSSWQTVGEFHLDGYREMYTGIQNLGDNPATDCQVQTWDGDSWEASGLTITGCADLAAGGEVLWARTSISPNNRFRVQMKSASGTTVECALYRRR